MRSTGWASDLTTWDVGKQQFGVLPRSGARLQLGARADDRRLLRRGDGDLLTQDSSHPGWPGVPQPPSSPGRDPEGRLRAVGLFSGRCRDAPRSPKVFEHSGGSVLRQNLSGPAWPPPRWCSRSWSCNRRGGLPGCTPPGPYKVKEAATGWAHPLGGDPQGDVPAASTGIFVELVLASGGALGETMALAMLIGNERSASRSIAHQYLAPCSP